ncbi:MAG: hypothetical protein WC484_03090, partial [Candidatus Omnitrophota bacterium]
MKKIKLIVLLTFSVIFTHLQAYAAPVPDSSQEMGGIDRTRELEERSKKLTSEIQKKRKKPGIEEEKLPSEVSPALPNEKMLIRNIVVTGATILPKEEIRGIIEP